MKILKAAFVTVSLLLSFPLGSNSIEASPSDALVILESTDIESMQQARKFIKEKGGRITHIYPTHILIGDIPEAIYQELVGERGILAVHYDSVDPTSVEEYGKTAVYAVQACNNNFMTLAAQMGLAPEPGAPQPSPIIGDALIPPDESPQPEVKGMLAEAEMAAAPSGATLRDTSEYMIGDIAVGIILMESNGVTDANTEDWTSTEESNVISEIQAAMNWWVAREPNANLTFTYDINYQMATNYEPINRPGPASDGQGLWIPEAMTTLGYTTYVSYFDNVHDYNGAIRDANNADWGFTIFVVDSSNDSDNKFTDNYFAYAYLGGPFQVMTYGNDGYGIANMDAVCAHETGHIFYALDEYASAGNSATDRSGYLNVENQNNEGDGSSNVACIMRGQVSPFTNNAVCTYTRGQVSLRDTDADSILDIIDTYPNTTLTAYSPDPTTDSTPTYTGSATVVPYPNSNPYGTGNDISINTIGSVQYRVDSGTWTATTASDGAFNEATESFTFTPSALADGTYTFETRATNSVGNIETSYASDTLTIQTIYALSNGLPETYGDIPKDFSFSVLSYDWCGIGIYPTTDHDIRTDDNSDFSSPYASSTYTGTTRDFVVVNGHSWGNVTHYAQVYYGSSSTYTIEAEWNVPDLTVDSAYSDTMSTGEVLQMYEVPLTAGQWYQLTVDISSGSGDLSVYVFKPTRSYGRRFDYDWRSNSAGAGGDESLTLTADSTGDYGIIVINENNASANYTIKVALNQAPVINPVVPNISNDEDTPTSYDLTSHETDVEDSGTGLDWSISGVNSSLFTASINIDTDVLTITPVANASGSDVVTLTLTDTGALTDTQDITVTINSVNDAPVINPVVPNISTDEDTPTSYDLTSHETDAEDSDTGLDWSISGVDTSLFSASIDTDTDVLTITPVANANGSDVVTLTLTDTGGLTDTQDITVTISSVNDAPVISPVIPDPAAVDEDNSITIDLTSYETDVEDSGTSLDWTVSGEDNCTVSGENSDDDVLTITPSANFYGTDTITLTLTDSDGGTDTQDITLTWNSVNDAPVISPVIPDIIADEDTPTTSSPLTSHETDVEDSGTGLDWSISGVDSSLFSASIDTDTDVLTITPVANANGSDVVTLTLTDTGGLTDTQDITVTISSVNDAPVISPMVPDITTIENTPVGYNLTSHETDVEDSGTGLDWSISGVNTSLFSASIYMDTDLLTITPVTDGTGSDVVTLTLTDTDGAIDTQDITVTISPNQSPNPFSLLSPASGIQVITTPTLDWEDSSDPGPGDTVTYTLWLDDDPDFSSLSLNKTGLDSSTYKVTIADSLDDNTVYHWKVKAVDNHGKGIWSTETDWYFVANNANEPPDSFSLILPSKGSSVTTLTPTFDWADTTDPDPGDTFTYTLWYDANSDFSTKTEVTGLTENTYTPGTNLADKTTYYWKVKTVDSYGAERWSTQTDWSFEVDAGNQPPIPFSLISPTSGAEVTTTPTLDWEDSPDPDPDDTVTYTLWIDDDNEFGSLDVEKTGLTSSAYTVTTADGLIDNSIYYWKVKAIDNHGAETWSTQTDWSYIVGTNDPPTDFFLLSPIDGSTVTTLIPTFDWADTTDPDPGDTFTYTLWYDTNSDFSTKIEVTGLIDSTYTPGSNLGDKTTYYWKVKAVDNHDADTWSTQTDWSFTIDTYYQPSTLLQFVPSSQSVSVGDTFTLDIYLSIPDGVFFDSISTWIEFDETYLDVVDTDTGNWITEDINIFDASHYPGFDAFNSHLANNADNSIGEIDYDESMLAGGMTSSGTFASTTFRAKEAVVSTNISFKFGTWGSLPNTSVTFAGSDLLGTEADHTDGTRGATVSINSPPEVNILAVTQRVDGSGRMEVSFTGTDAENDTVTWVATDCEYSKEPYDTWNNITFNTEDSSHTADEPMVFSSVGTDFVAVMDASGWTDESYKVRLKVNDGKADSIQQTSHPFAVDNTPPQVEIATAQSSTIVRITFNEAVKHSSASNSDDALNPANYSISPSLLVTSVSHVSEDNTFDLTTSIQNVDTDYTLTASNVADTVGNVIDPSSNSATFNGYGNAPELTITLVSKRADGSGHIEISFTGIDAEDDNCWWVDSDCEYSMEPYTTWMDLNYNTGDSAHTAHEPMAFSSTGQGFVAVVDASGWTSGSYKVRLKVNDGVADSAQVTSSAFTLDNTEPDSPVITTNSGNDYATIDSSITLEGTCSADTVAIYVNGSTEGVTYTPGETSWTYTGTLEPGENTFDITAEDAAGNVSDAGSITITNLRPHKPDLSSPADGKTDVSLTPELQTGDFSHPGGAGFAHALTGWQISTESTFSSLVLDITSSSHLNSLRVPHSILDEGTTYYWQVIFYDNNLAVSEWSDPYFFTTLTTSRDLNSNGIPDEQEVDDTVDLDGDGTPDIYQSDIKDVMTIVGDGIIGVSFKDSYNVSSIEWLESIDPTTITDTANTPENIPLGLITFKLTVNNPGDTAVLTVYLAGVTEETEDNIEAFLAIAKWYKYDYVDGWQDYSDHATFSADRKSVVLELKDGGFGDADGTANGIIVDPSGPGAGNQAPIASFVADPTWGEESLSVSFDATASNDPDGIIESYVWDFGDGISGSGASTSHEYVSVGTYTVTLTVIDDDGATDSVTIVITVTDEDDIGTCFLDVAAYGSPMEPHVKILRDFRNRYLFVNAAGKGFVRFYYYYSPPIANFIAKHKSLRAFVRVILLPFVGVSWLTLNIGLIPTLVFMLMLLTLMSATAIVLFRKTVLRSHRK